MGPGDMTEQELEDISSLLSMVQREKAWPRQRLVIEAIEARYSGALSLRWERKAQDLGWTRTASGWAMNFNVART